MLSDSENKLLGRGEAGTAEPREPVSEADLRGELRRCRALTNSISKAIAIMDEQRRILEGAIGELAMHRLMSHGRKRSAEGCGQCGQLEEVVSHAITELKAVSNLWSLDDAIRERLPLQAKP